MHSLPPPNQAASEQTGDEALGDACLMDEGGWSLTQLKLFRLENPLTTRLGGAFFRAVPEAPGVYRFFAADERLLYIGQSGDLRARVGSYRHVTPERHSRRILRLVARVTRIEWEVCESAAAAIARESALLLEHRPPFNRAGVWRGPPWWLSASVEGGRVCLQLGRDEGPDRIGPLPASFRYVLGAIVRSVLKCANPALRLADFPPGLMAFRVPLELRLHSGPSDWLRDTVIQAARGDCGALLAGLGDLPPSASATEQAFWEEDRESLERHARRCLRAP